MSSLVTDIREMIHEQFEFSGLLWQITKRDLMLRYKQTVMGVGWAIFTPLINTLVFSIIFMRVTTIVTPVPYPVFAYSGLAVWNFFASAQKFAVMSLASNSVLVTKVYFPREVLPLSTVFVSFIDFLVSLVVLAGFMIYYRVAPGPNVLWFPVVLVPLFAFTMGVALLLSMANLFFRDVKYLFEIVLTVGMFATSVVYPAEAVGGKLGMLMKLNPMTAIVDAFRRVVLYNQHPWTPDFIVVLFLSFGVLGVSWIWFHRSEFRFAESV
jgi:lipopolysaccharide transport system permease protein